MTPTQNRISIFALLTVFALPACSESSNGASVEAFTAACEAVGNMNNGLCKCIGENAKRDLTPRGFEFFTAMMQKDDAKTAALRSEMEFTELTDASMYLLNGAQTCAEAAE